MNSLSLIRWDSIFLCSLILISSFLLWMSSASLGVLMLIWATFTLLKYIKIVGVTAKDNTATDQPVSRLIKGLEKDKNNKDLSLVKAGLKTPLMILFAISLISAAYLYMFQDSYKLEVIAYMVLGSLIFWHIQNSSLNPDRASILGTLFASVFCMQIVFFHDFHLNTIKLFRLEPYYFIAVFIACYLGYTFCKGLIQRHKYHLFPATGLFLLIFTVIMFSQMQIMVLPILAALFGICFAQSFSTSRRRYFVYSPYNEVLS